MVNRLMKKCAFAAVTVVLTSFLMTAAPAWASPGTCQSTNTGCVSWYKDSGDQYRFDSSDSSLFNNRFVTENCDFPYAPCSEDLRVQDHLGQMRLNSATYVRMCIYQNAGYSVALYWVEIHGNWYSTSPPGASLQYKPSHGC